MKHDIPNEQLFDTLSALEVQARRNVFSRKYPNNKERNTLPTQVYNCHGLTFGGRRTQIDHTPTIRMILNDDRYKRILNKEDVLAGDIVLFVAPNGDIEHSAIVVERPSDTITGMPKVVSKWGGFTEFIHYANESEYDASNLEYYRVEWP